MRKFVLAAVLVLMASGAQAATLNVIGGQLMGASDVLVDGNLYDVQLLDGSCADLYGQCDEASDFTFQTLASAHLASQALLDQVFLDVAAGPFDSSPALTFGCFNPVTPSTECWAFTPYQLRPSGLSIMFSALRNLSIDPDQIFPFLMQGDALASVSYDTTPTNAVYVIWTQAVVPEPSSALLLGLGLTGLAAKGRRRS